MMKRQKIIDLLSHVNFDYLLIETTNTINHIEKIKNSQSIANFFWAIKDTVPSIDFAQLPKTYFLAESFCSEFCAWSEKASEPIIKISALLVITEF